MSKIQMDRLLSIIIGALLALLPISHVSTLGMDLWQVPRETDDLDHDTIDQLVRLQRYEDAIDLCKTESRKYPPDSLRAAQWAVRHSQVLVAKISQSDDFDEASVTQAIAPVSNLLDAYPDHEWAIFLQAQVHQSKKQSVLNLIFKSAVAPLNQPMKEQAIRSSVEIADSMSDFIEEIAEKRLTSRSESRAASDYKSNDLYRLQQVFTVDVVSLALMQSELLAAEGNDFIAAATRAEKLAEDAISILPLGSEARSEVIRLRIEALIKMKQSESANEVFQRSNISALLLQSPRWCASKARLKIATSQELQARDELVSFYKKSLEEVIADDSVTVGEFCEADLALLQFFIRYGTSKRVTDCLDWIEGRGGRYARLRADAIALREMFSRSDNGSLKNNPAMIAARSQQLINAGDLRAGAELLVLASDLSILPDESIGYSTQAAAAFASLNQHQRAAEILRSSSLRNRNSLAASSVHLQSLVISASLEITDKTDLQNELREHLRLWPRTDTARSARVWLYELFQRDDKFLEAALVITGLLQEPAQEPNEKLISESWHRVLDQKSVNWKFISDAFSNEFPVKDIHPTQLDTHKKLSLILLDVSRLSDLDLNTKNEFENRIYQLRTGIADSKALSNLDQTWLQFHWIADLVSRLVADAQFQPDRRVFIAEALLALPGNHLTIPNEARCLIWCLNVEAAIRKLDLWTEKTADSLDRLVASAELLQETDDPIALTRAADIWSTVAAGMQIGTEKWHQAKIARIEALRKAGDTTAAKKLAKYLLLTSPDLNEFWRDRYREQLESD